MNVSRRIQKCIYMYVLNTLDSVLITDESRYFDALKTRDLSKHRNFNCREVDIRIYNTQK